MKTIVDQGERQKKAIPNQIEIKTIKKYTYSDKDVKKINKLVEKKFEEITNLDKKVNPDDLTYRRKVLLLMQKLMNLIMCLVFWVK